MPSALGSQAGQELVLLDLLPGEKLVAVFAFEQKILVVLINDS